MGTVVEFDLGLGIIEQTAALRRYARFLTRTVDQADDLVQDCIARALSRPQLYRPDTNLKGWLFTMLRNIAISQSRRAKTRQAYATALMVTASASSAPNQVHSRALTESLNLIKTLRSPEREAIALLGIFDMTYEEAALHAGSNVGTMKSRLSRARARLRSLAEPALKFA